MTKADRDLSGEARMKLRRSRLYRYLGLVFLGSLIAGMAGGAMANLYEDGAIPLWLPVLACAIVAIGMAWFMRDYFRRVDELDVMDNLWAHLIGFYGGAIVFGVWYFLADLGLVGGPSALALFALMMSISAAAYGLRKLGLR